MKFHKPLVQAVIDTLYKIFEEGVYADKAHSISGSNTRFQLYTKMTNLILKIL